jgi:tetratricopeptide (TPR) repeat protein
MIVLISIIQSNTLYCKYTDKDVVKAISLMDKGKYSEASKIFDSLLIHKPNDLVVLYNAAFCEVNNGRPDLAKNYLQVFLSKNKGDADVINVYGLANERLGYVDSAIANYTAAIKLDKNFYEAYFNRGRCQIIYKNYDSARSDFEFAKKSKIIIPNLYIESAELYFGTGEFSKAIADLKKIEKYKSTEGYYLQLLANAYFIEKEFNNAITYYSKLITLDSENVTALNNRAVSYDQLELNDKAASDRAKIIEIQKRNGIDPNSLNYNILMAEDSSFSIEIPSTWRTLTRTLNDTSDIIFFNPDFSYSGSDGMYKYDCGGSIQYIKKYFTAKPNLSLENQIALRDSMQSVHIQDRIEQRSRIMPGYSEKLRKQYNPNEFMSRELRKCSYYDKGGEKEFAGVEFFVITTDGELLCLYIWMPYENYFIWERVLDRIQESLIVYQKDTSK